MELAAKLVLAKIEYVGLACTPLLFLAFTARYSGFDRWLRGRRKIVLWLLAAVTTILAATNEMHHWLWTDYLPGPAGTNSFVYIHGPAYYLVAAYVYLLVLIGCVLVARSAFRHSGPQRRQAITILSASIVPLVAGLLYVIDVSVAPGLDIVPVSFAVTGLVFLIGIGFFRVFDVVPAARSALIEQTADPVIVADAAGHIVDANPAAARWLGTTEPLIGCAVADVLHPWPALRTACIEARNTHVELTLGDDPLLHVDVHVTPLHEPHGDPPDASSCCGTSRSDIETNSSCSVPTSS